MIFNYVIIVVMSVSQTQCQFYSLESDNLIYPLFMNSYLGNTENGNIYSYDVNSYGINSLSDNFNIGIWVSPTTYISYCSQLIMHINGNEITMIYQDSQIKIFEYSYGYFYLSSYLSYSWIYVFYQQNKIYGIQQICFVQIYFGPNPTCISLPSSNYFNFGFLQPTANLNTFIFDNYYENLYSFYGQAISITIKKMNMLQDFNFQMIDLMTLMSYVEPEVILDLKIYERTQTKILKDWSNYQHILQMGNSLDYDIYDPQIIVNHQMLQFSNQQYIQIENFKVSKTLTIEIQVTSDSFSEEFIILSFNSRRDHQNTMQIIADFYYQQITVFFTQYGISFSCHVDFQYKLMIGIINLVQMTIILFSQNDSILSLNPYNSEIDITNTDTLYIGSMDNLSSQSFYISSLRISNGFYSPYSYQYDGICTYSINECFQCFNGYYLFQGQCVLQCPTYYEINQQRQECIPKCHPTCLDCDQANPTYCLICAGIRMNEPDCKCPPGYFDDGISPDCIRYLPDISIDQGIFEFDCFSPDDKYYQINFAKQYLYSPSVAISLLGHLDYDDEGQREFQVFVDRVTTIYFYLRVICNTYDGRYKIQWTAGKSSSFLNVIQTDYSGSFYNAFLYPDMYNTVIGAILGWCLDYNYLLQIDLNLQQLSSYYFYFVSSQYLFMLKYQYIYFTNYIYYQFNQAFNTQNQQQYFSIGGASILTYLDQFPLSIPTFLSIKRININNSFFPQYYITEKKRPGQIEIKLKTQGYVSVDYFNADLIYLVVQCNDPLNSCDYIEQLQKCNKILSDCQCNSSQYFDAYFNICIDCYFNCLTCDIYYTNCKTCSEQSQKSLILDISTNYYYCGCKISQYEDVNGICQECDSNCQQCQTTSTYCTSCYDINQIVNVSNQCECQINYLQTEIGCQMCQSPCYTCELTLTNCLSCQYSGQVIPTCSCPTGQKVVGGICTQYCPILCLDCDTQTSCNTCVSLSSFNNISNACECQNGYFNNSIECQICLSPCVNCISSNQCTSCIDQTYYIDITCLQCISPCLECTALNYCLTCINDSYYLSSNQCQSCVSPCLTCSDLTICKSCIDNTYYHDSFSLNCLLCISPCLTCETDIYCYTCINTNYYLSSTNICLNCVFPCLTCSSETSCIDCNVGYYIDANMICQPCISPCVQCSSIDVCNLCSDGYFIDANSICQLCLKPCLTCITSSSNCLSCIDPTMTISSGNCVCASNQYYDSLALNCQNCHPTCTTCLNSDYCCDALQFLQFNTLTNACECQNGYYLQSSNSCSQCVSPCLFCSSLSICTSCINGYYLSSSSSCLICTSPCQNCINTTTECLSCVSITMVLVNQTCTCPSNYYINSNQTDCILCHPTCLTCTDSNHCCFSTEYKILDSINNLCKCQDGYYDTNGICQQCNQNCLTCETTSTNCLSCNSQFKLEAQECKCLISNQFINNLGVCENCSTNCLTCSISPNNCLSCDQTKKYQLIQGVCQCKTNEYLNDNGICTECHKTCLSCINGLEIGCLGCITSRKMNPENKLCECTDGQFKDNNNECIKCNNKCGKCLNDHECLTCSENRSLSQDGVSCICNNGYFENEKVICQRCSPPCSTCSNTQDCLSCIDVNREVVQARCQCQKGFFENEQNQCESCSSIRGKVNDICNYINCGDGELTKGEQCDDGNNLSRDGCTDCKIDQLFTCVNKMLSRSICFQCVTNCQTCSLKGFKSSCDQCYNGYFLKNDECLKCQDSCYTCKDNKTCLTCTIIDAQPDEKGICPKCTNIKGYYIINRKCVTKCGDAILVESEQCDDGNNLDGDGCSSQCQIEKYYTCKETICTKIPQPEVEATYTNSTTTESMTLNFPIDQGDPCTKINITIDSFLPNDFLSFIKYEQIDDNQSKCDIDFQFNKTIDVGNLIHIFIPVKVRTSKRVLEEETREIIITPRKKIIYSQNQVQQAESASNAQSTLGDMLYFIAPTAIILGGFNFFWTIMDILSWINNLYYINIYFPENVKMFFQNSAWGDFQLFPAFFVLNQPQDPYYIESPKKFMEKGVDPIFLNNTWTCFAIIAITISIQIISCFILFFIELIWPPIITKTSSSIQIFQLNEINQSNQFNSNTENKFTKNKKQEFQPQKTIVFNVNHKKRFPYLIDKIYQPLHKFKINFLSNLIKSLNLAFLDLVLAIILQITTIPNSLMAYQIVFINQILSYVSISICVITLIISYYVTTKHHLLLEHELFKNQYGTLYENINTKSRTAMLYSYINLNRKALFIIVVVYFYYQPLLQTVFSCFISFLNIALIIYENPFTSKADLIQNGIPDFCIFVLMLLSTGFALDDIIGLLNADQRFQIGWLMIGTIGLSILVQIVFLLREFIRDLQEKFLMVSQKIKTCLKSSKNQ